MSGIVGLGLPSITAKGTVAPFDKIMQQKDLEHNIIAIRLGKFANDIGEIRFGDVDTEVMGGDFIFTPVISEVYWEVEVGDMLINGASTGACNYMLGWKGICGAAIDSGTSVIGGPSVIIDDLIYSLGLNSNCSNAHALPEIAFVIGGRAFTLKPEDYIIQDDGECRLAFMSLDVPAPRGPIFVLGDTFMRKFYTVLDRDNMQIGFAPLKKPDEISYTVRNPYK